MMQSVLSSVNKERVNLTAPPSRRGHNRSSRPRAPPHVSRWGPSHSMDSEEDDDDQHHSSRRKQQQQQQHDNANDRTESTKEETSGSRSSTTSPQEQQQPHATPKSALDRLYESAMHVITPPPPTSQSPRAPTESSWAVMFHDACRRCTPDQAVDSVLLSPIRSNETNLGISPMVPPHHHHQQQQQQHDPLDTLLQRTARSTDTSGTPAARRRRRHSIRQQQRLQTTLKPAKPLPLDTLELPQDDHTASLERSISELTMKSSYGEATAPLADARRMAYYAVGKHHKHASRVGNRRCYFTGTLIGNNRPFYAGSVQQGLRTLVVFCLPSAMGLPARDMTKRQLSAMSSSGTIKSGKSHQSSGRIKKQSSLRRKSTRSTSASRPSSWVSSLDDTGASYEEDCDPNWDLDRDYLLRILPEPNQKLLDSMAEMYPEQYQTLPMQVRSPSCWRLFVKFCFFSGLPIAEGEMHYKVREKVANELYGEEIILSHEVMEAVNGDSAEILRLPNLKTFKYLRKHYSQQCGKLSESVFRRESWEEVLPEI